MYEHNDAVRDLYFEWLCDMINLQYDTYDILIYELYNIPFFWKIELDANRAEDGIILRGYFHNDDGTTALDTFADKPCSVLEMLIALSKKMDYLLADDGRGDRTRIWFWEMISNLGLDKYYDAEFNEPFGEDMGRIKEIQQICDKWMNRNFSYRGYGSPFPLVRPHRDQRQQQLIDQMNDYILENYIVDDEIM